MQQCQVRAFHTIFVPSFDPNEWCLKNGLHSGGLNPGPLGLESSALTTRPRLLALVGATLWDHGLCYQLVNVIRLGWVTCQIISG